MLRGKVIYLKILNNMERSLKDVEWKEFTIGDIFKIQSTSSGIDKDKLIAKIGKIPYITRSEKENGYDSFIGTQDGKYKKNDANVITIGLDTQTVFYQPYEFYTGQNVQILTNSNLNKYNACFFIPLLKIQMEKFNWGGNGATLTRLKRSKILLPSNNDQPDYAFMEQYIRNIEEAKTKEYNQYIANRIHEFKTAEKAVAFSEKKWAEFEIGYIFNIKSGKRLTKADMKKGQMPFIGASDSNNGITEYVSNLNISIDSNVLGVNYNGSVVENFYHPYKALFSDDVKRFSLKNHDGNKYLYLFLKTLILKQKDKYQWGYKFNENRMLKQKILLPVDTKGEPDYLYMEQYMKQLEYNKLNDFLSKKIEQ